MDEEKQNKNTTATRKQAQTTQIKHEPSYKQLEAKMKQTLFLCGNRNGHHNMEFRA